MADDPVQLSAADLTALLRRTTDDGGWLEPILADPDGSVALGLAIAIMARASESSVRALVQSSISLSSGGSPGTSSLTVTRAAAGTSGTIPKGYKFVDARGAQLVLTAPVVVLAGDLSKTLALATFRQSDALNTVDDPGIAVDPGSGEALDSLGTTPLMAPAGDPAIVGTTFLPGAATPIQGATTDWLSVIGAERAQQRQPGEDTASYRARVKVIPDAVSPIAVGDAVQAAASRLGIPAIVLEPFGDGATAALKTMHGLGTFAGLAWSSTNSAGTVASAAASPGADFFDDGGDGREMLDARQATAYFRVLLETSMSDPGFEVLFYDADGAGYWDDFVDGYLDVHTPALMNAQGLAIWEEANRKRAGGVAFDVEIGALTKEQASGSTTSAVSVVVATLAPAAGRAWLVADLIAGRDTALNPMPPGAAMPAAARHQVRFTYSDASTFTTPAYAGLDSQRLTPAALAALGASNLPVTKIEGLARSDGAVIVNLALDARVLEMVFP